MIKSKLKNRNLSQEDVFNFSELFKLMKPRVMSLVIFTCAVGLLMAPNIIPTKDAIIGIILVSIGAGAAGALNMWYESDLDALMTRTCLRPIPTGKVNKNQALVFGIALSIFSVIALDFFANRISASLLLFTILFYVLVYTVWLKRLTPQNIVIGGLAGAMPPLLGWSAVTGTIEPGALILVFIIFAWTPPHFWALAIHRKDEYAKSGVPMLPVTHGEYVTKLHIIFYTGFLVVVSSMPYFVEMSGGFYLAASMVLGAGFLFFSWLLLIKPGPRTAMDTFRYSIVYLSLLFVALLIDHYLF